MKTKGYSVKSTSIVKTIDKKMSLRFALGREDVRVAISQFLSVLSDAQRAMWGSAAERYKTYASYSVLDRMNLLLMYVIAIMTTSIINPIAEA